MTVYTADVISSDTFDTQESTSYLAQSTFTYFFDILKYRYTVISDAIRRWNIFITAFRILLNSTWPTPLARDNNQQPTLGSL